MLRELGCDVHFLYVYDAPLRGEDKNYTRALEETGIVWGDKFHLYRVAKLQKFIFNLTNLYRKACCHNYVKCDDEYPTGLTRYVEGLHHQHHFDGVIINYYYLSKLLAETSIPKKAVLTHDCFTYRATFAESFDKQLKPNEESKSMMRCPNIFAVQDEEAAFFKRIAPRSKVFTTYANYKYRPSAVEGNHNILFFSGGNNYNLNGIRWFVEEVFPYIRKRIVDATLLIGGSICKALKTEYESKEGIRLYGYVDDPLDFYSQGDIAINPVFQGTGIKIKTFEALSYDKVVMVHPHSLEGIFQSYDTPIFCSDEPEEWATYLQKVWSDNQMIPSIKQQNRQYMESLNDFIHNEYQSFLEA